MTARDLLVLLDRPCVIRHADETTTPGVLVDAREQYGELRCTVRHDALDDFGRLRPGREATYPGSRVWLVPSREGEALGIKYIRADMLRRARPANTIHSGGEDA